MKLLRSFFNAIWKVVGLFLLYQVILRFIRKRYPFPVPAFVGRFLDSDLRRAMQPPQPTSSTRIPGRIPLRSMIGWGRA